MRVLIQTKDAAARIILDGKNAESLEQAAGASVTYEAAVIEVRELGLDADQEQTEPGSGA